MATAPLPHSRSVQGVTLVATLGDRIRQLEMQVVDTQGALDVVRYLADMMLEHPNASVRVYGDSILKGIADPDAWQAAIAADVVQSKAPVTSQSRVSTGYRGNDESARVLTVYVDTWKEALGADADRVLGPFLARVSRTADGLEHERERGWMCTDWVVREYTSFWLCQIGKGGDATRILGMPPVRTLDDLALRAAPVISATADQIEEESAAIERRGLAHAVVASAMIQAAHVAEATGGGRAALAAMEPSPVEAVRLIEAARTLWAWRSAAAPDGVDASVADLCQEIIGLQVSATRLLDRLLGPIDDANRRSDTGG